MDHHALQCDLCTFSHHTECEAVSNQLYKIIQDMANEDSANSLHWYCKKCNRMAKGFMSGIAQLQERQTVLEDKFLQLQGNMTGQIVQLESTVKELAGHIRGKDTKLQELESGLKMCKDKIKEPVNVEDIVGEVQDRERRYCNAIVFNLWRKSARS